MSTSCAYSYGHLSIRHLQNINFKVYFKDFFLLKTQPHFVCYTVNNIHVNKETMARPKSKAYFKGFV